MSHEGDYNYDHSTKGGLRLVLANARERIVTLEAENKKLKKSRDAWRELAQHARCLFSQRQLGEHVHALDNLERQETSE